MDISDKILKNVIGFCPKAFKEEADAIQVLINKDRLAFAKWFLFMDKQTDNFEKWTDKELVLMYKKEHNL